MPKSVLETLDELRNNRPAALAQLIAILSEMCKQHELQAKNFAGQLREPFIASLAFTSPRQSPIRRQREALPEIDASVRVRQAQSRTAYIHRELAVLDNIVLDQLSEVQVSDDDVRQGDFMTQQEELETQQLLLSVGDTVRAGEDIESFEERIQKLQLDDESLTLSGFKNANASSAEKSRVKARSGLEFDANCKIELVPRNLQFKVLQSDSELQESRGGIGDRLADYAERIRGVEENEQELPLEAEQLIVSDVVQNALPDSLAMSTSALDLKLPASIGKQYEAEFVFSDQFKTNKVQGFMEMLMGYRDGILQLDQLEGDLRVKEVQE